MAGSFPDVLNGGDAECIARPCTDFIRRSLFDAEVSDLFGKVLADQSFDGLTVKHSNRAIQLVVKTGRSKELLSEDRHVVEELRALVVQRFGIPARINVKVVLEKSVYRGLSARLQAEAVRYKITEGLAARRAANSVMNYIMRGGATGCQIVVSGKIKGQRAKAMKFTKGDVIATSDMKKHYIQEALCVASMKQGVMGVKVIIMLPYDPNGVQGCSAVMHGVVKLKPIKNINQPKEVAAPTRESNTGRGPQRRNPDGYRRYDNGSKEQVSKPAVETAPETTEA